jgi:hypothetical protein
MISPNICLEGIYSGGQKKASSMSSTVGNFIFFSLKVFTYKLCSKSCKGNLPEIWQSPSCALPESTGKRSFTTGHRNHGEFEIKG